MNIPSDNGERKAELLILMNIVDRAYVYFRNCNISELLSRDRISLLMDIDAAHKQHILDLVGLLDANEESFMHDIVGIVNHMNRNTGRIEDDFIPHYLLR